MQNNMGGIVNAINLLIEAVKALKTAPTLTVYSDASRPAATSVPAGYIFFNSSDNFPNISDGTNWRDMSGSIT